MRYGKGDYKRRWEVFCGMILRRYSRNTKRRSYIDLSIFIEKAGKKWFQLKKR